MTRFLALALGVALFIGPHVASAKAQTRSRPAVCLFPNYFYVLPPPILLPPTAGVIDPPVAIEEER